MEKKELKRNAYSFILGVTIGSAVLLGTRKIDCDNKLGIEFNIDDKDILLDNDIKIDEYLKEKVTFSDVRNTIRHNKNLTTIDKNAIIDIVDKLEEKVPYIDLRCFNYNCKNLKIIRDEIEEKNVSGVFNSHKDSITLESENTVIFNHEILHLLNNLDQEIDGKRIIKNYSCDNKNLTYQTEAFTEWLNSYIFGYPTSSYQTEISNLNIMKKLLNISDPDLIKIFVNKNYKAFASLLVDKNKKFTKVDEMLEKNKNNIVDLNDEQIEKITDIYLDTYIKINGSQINDRLYQFIDYLCKNYVLNCTSTYNKQITFKNKVIKKASDKLKIKNPIIYDYFDQKEEYLNIDNLYLVCSKDEYDNKSYFLAEKYNDEDGNEILVTNLQKIYLNYKVYDCNYRETDYRISTNQIGEEEQINIHNYTPVKNLLCGNVEMDINELITNYENNKQQSKAKKHNR